MKTVGIRVCSLAILFIGLQVIIHSQERIKIVVIPKSNTSYYWKLVRTGIKLGAVALSRIDIEWRAPEIDHDKAQQISILEECITEGVSGIVLSPLDNVALAIPVAKALKKNIPVLIFDSALKGKPGKDFICFVGIDNSKAGKIAGEELAKLLGGKGKVVLLGSKGSSNIIAREEGFLETLAKYKGLQLIKQISYTGTSSDEAMDASMKMADQLKEADGIFCSREILTIGMLNALRNLHLIGKVKFIGFDTPAAAVDALKKGEMSALISQNPARMGFFAIKTIVDHIRGKEVPSTIDIDVQIITRENINDPNIQKLLILPGIKE
ncbi:MAG: substrate-binding domain-containing protein [bacterium]